MDDLERRLLTMELEAKHERELSDWRHAEVSRRLQRLEQNPVMLASIAKIATALVLPIGVWLLTGDLRKALAAFRLMGGG
jgi:hypothetical protein